MKQTWVLSPQTRQIAIVCVADAPDGCKVTIDPKPRTNAQNDYLWTLLKTVSLKVNWYGQYISTDAWKAIFTSSWKKQQIVPGLDGEFVAVGYSTSDMSDDEMSDLLTLIEAFIDERGVRLPTF